MILGPMCKEIINQTKIWKKLNIKEIKFECKMRKEFGKKIKLNTTLLEVQLINQLEKETIK